MERASELKWGGGIGAVLGCFALAVANDSPGEAISGGFVIAILAVYCAGGLLAGGAFGLMRHRAKGPASYAGVGALVALPAIIPIGVSQSGLPWAWGAAEFFALGVTGIFGGAWVGFLLFLVRRLIAHSGL